MGISGLLPMLKEISEDIHIKSFAGQVAAIDAYCWIHRAAIFCAEELILGIETSRCVELNIIFHFDIFEYDLNRLKLIFTSTLSFFRYVELCMKYIDVLLANKVRPIMVFDGFSLDAKREVESTRRR